MNDAERQAAIQHYVGILCLLKIDGDVFKILAKRRGLPLGKDGEILTEKPYQRDQLIKLLRDFPGPAEVLIDGIQKIPA